MIQAHVLTRVIVDLSYRDHWVGGFNNIEAVYDVTWEYDNGGNIQESVVIPLIDDNKNRINRLAAIKDELEPFQVVNIANRQRIFTPVAK